MYIHNNVVYDVIIVLLELLCIYSDKRSWQCWICWRRDICKALLSWGLDCIDQVSPILDGIFEPRGDGEGVDIYILDRAIYTGYDPVDNYYGTNQTGRDYHRHGTHVASLACGKYYGVAKKNNCYSVRVIHCFGPIHWSIIIDGLNYATTNIINIRILIVQWIISMSLRGL